MCCCQRPNKNGQPGYSWDGKSSGICSVLPPDLKPGETLIYDEPGRCGPQVNGKGETDYHLHHFRVVQSGKHGPYRLAVEHGAGYESFDIGYNFTRIVEILAPMDSDSRYLMLHGLFSAWRNGASVARLTEHETWTKAAADKRIKTRKMPGRNEVKVWIEPERVAVKAD